MQTQRIKINSPQSIRSKPEHFIASARGKTNSITLMNDRDYKVGDRIILKEHNGKNFTGREITGEITYITDHEQKDGHILCSYKKFSVNMQTKKEHSYNGG